MRDSRLLLGPEKDSPLGLPLFGVVDLGPGGIYRSGQPAPRGFVEAERMGIRTVINLRAETEDFLPQHSGLSVVRFPWVDEAAPSMDSAESFLGYVANRNAALRPLLVHCKAGRGRTSVAAALIRYSIDGWGMIDALRELRLYRMIGLAPFLVHWRLAAAQHEFLIAWSRRFAPGTWQQR